ncbi:BTB domain and ankyrin repeat containing protein [Cordyceps fumosorosea ARSEF 2679]|uniref:BTB domain and ankyrin repeat containing protein n=1 Tax=Cordyceps fumosorosea (strain ARSEF 2679) TaxID=1081104 RepID=A0A162MUA3_CORFA|nr:BTB domain and ankyrin repeat containing protein [Cordyceps fumosorosea ARSEF 2679]OAA70529.1 BTB domain and ankyrin repeat containing protein [Cordyceps fumosorosea ARSEF 2679]
MSHLLWKYYWENDVDRFRRLLDPAAAAAPAGSKSPVIGSAGWPSPGGLSSSPRLAPKSRKAATRFKDSTNTIGRAEINSRDHSGLTILLRAASSTDPTARDFVHALVEHPAIDLCVQDPESGWNALHRSLYSGNVSIARIILAKERENILSGTTSSTGRVGRLIKTKDHEGNSPFDVYNSTIATRSLNRGQLNEDSDNESDSGESTADYNELAKSVQLAASSNDGDELFVFGSNRNMSLGVGDEDDRQYPERIHLQRPDGLLRHLYESYLGQEDAELIASSLEIEDIPIMVRSLPLLIQDIAMSKLHTAVLTTDPVSNLFIAGLGRGGRLGLGDENTQFRFVPVQGPLADKKIRQVALGQNHSMAIAGNGELWTWGLNSDSQLGYALPPPTRADEEPMSLIPRQVFGTLKKEIIQGVAASTLHSVAYTGTSLFCWGRNIGQLALMDADSRSLDIQTTPRRVAASLLTAPIVMVSAIDKATTVLLANHNVWVFTNYGYNLVKFPTPDVFANHNLTFYATRRETGRKDIVSIASGGDTIAAVTSRGDLFTMSVNSKGDLDQPNGSTTNPSKIKGAVSQPQCVWDSRKDGVTSMSVGEHGSVIICTESGAVWKRVKRTKGNLLSGAGAKKKDFKFERIPYITNCTKVRSSTFGAFAAIRKDSKVMAEEISVAKPSIWEDIGSLLCLNDFEASMAKPDPKDPRKAWDKAIAREKHSHVVHELLKSSDLESDLAYMLDSTQFDNIDLRVCTTATPDIKIPVHGWLLSARSPVVLGALSKFRRGGGGQSNEDVFTLSEDEGSILVTFQQIDILTLLNVVLFAYLDTTMPVWKYTKEAIPLAHRHRQVRTELMKLATRLQMPKLESAARLQGSVEHSLDSDLQSAISDKRFFEDGDILVQLDGEDIPVHSQLVCQRCPFFEGMFHGRSQGGWLTTRRLGQTAEDLIEVDLQHVNPETFMMVIQYIYGDVGEDLFEDVTSASLDEFSETVLDVMATANELMLDRLSQSCQSVIGKFVTTRNIANLLNEISPCSVTEFKDVGLEYICLQLENMLENGNLDGMDEEVLLDLDEVVRENQLARLPFVRSGRAELLLHEKYPDLLVDIEEERQRRVKEFAFKATQRQRDEEKKLSSSYRARFGSLDEVAAFPRTPDAGRRKSNFARNEPFSPNLRPKESHGDLIFDMDEDVAKYGAASSPGALSPIPPLDLDVEPMAQLPEAAWQQPKKKHSVSFSKSPSSSAPIPAMSTSRKLDGTPLTPLTNSARKASGPWASPVLSTTKLDLRGIMSEASPKPTSALAASLAAASKDAPSPKAPVKMSQKERKRQMQKHAELQVSAENEKISSKPWQPVSSGGSPAPWKAASPAPKVSLQEAMAFESQKRGLVPNAKPLVAAETEREVKRRTASPDTKFSGQNRNRRAAADSPASTSKQAASRLVPHSKSYITRERKEEPLAGATLADIIGQQEREQELVKEAVAKRSLQEIQQEQAFQEWWDQESRRAQEEEQQRSARPARERGDGGAGKRGRRARGGGGGGGASTGHAGAGWSKPSKGKEAADKGETPRRATPGSRSRGGDKVAAGKGAAGRGGKK